MSYTRAPSWLPRAVLADVPEVSVEACAEVHEPLKGKPQERCASLREAVTGQRL